MDKKLLIEKEYGKENETAVYERISRSILDFWGIKDENITSYSILEGTNIIYRICYDNPLYETLSVPNKNYQLETLIIHWQYAMSSVIRLFLKWRIKRFFLKIKKN